MVATRRLLTPAESRLVTAQRSSLVTLGRKRLSALVLTVGPIAFALWAVTLLLSDISWPAITIFWIAVGAILALWIGRDLRNELETRLVRMQSILRRNAADAFEIKASAFAELEQVEDEGACYAFQLDDDEIVFVVGQEFYPRANFPCLNFSLIYLLGEDGQRSEPLIRRRGPRATPQLTISAQTKRALSVPDHLEIVPGRLASLEVILRRGQDNP